jgi:polysaccharide biosynthesis/export protein
VGVGIEIGVRCQSIEGLRHRMMGSEGFMKLLKALLASAVLLTGSQALADTYKLRPGDTVEVIVWQDQKLNRKAVIAPDGNIALPLAGRIKVGGRTATEAESALKARLQPKYVEELDVTVSYLESPKRDANAQPPKPREWTVYVTGEVQKPGSFVVPKKAPNALQAIALAGGIGPFGAVKRIQIHRKVDGAEYVYEFDYSKYEKGMDLDGNITLRDGDVIVVPERKIFE